MNTSRQEIQRLLREVFELNGQELTLESGPEEVENWDSLNHLNLMVALEEQYRVSFSSEEIASVQNIGDLVSLLRHHDVDVAW